jgi:hypothetical protein
MLQDIQKKQLEMEKQIKQLTDNAKGDTAATEGFDRKLMKERLKKSLDKQTSKVDKAIERSGCLDYVFGIRKHDQRMGKQGSR